MNDYVDMQLIQSDKEGVRLDTYLNNEVEDISRSYIKKLILNGYVLVNDKIEKPSYNVKKGDKILIKYREPEELKVEPENIPIDILYEDHDILVVNKPQGMVVHPAPGNYNGTLVNAVLYHCKGQLSGINGVIRPGIVHRLDKDTSGAILIAKTDYAHINLAEQIQKREVKKIYNTIVFGNIKEDSGTIDEPIGRHPVDRKKMAVIPGGRNAISHYHVLERFGDFTYIEVKIDTGRTHQIRVHMNYIKHPVLGDVTYGPKKQPFNLDGQALHARFLGFYHPVENKWMEIEAPLPDYFLNILDKLRK